MKKMINILVVISIGVILIFFLLSLWR